MPLEQIAKDSTSMSGFLRRAPWIPRGLARWLRDRYLAALDLADRVRGRSRELVPPRSLHCIGGGDFRVIGEIFFRHFVDVCGLRPDETVLDIGCGTGRMAVPLVSYIRSPGGYVGFDISEKAIRWCRAHIARRNPRFRFVFADIENLEYNPRGKVHAREYRFPCGTESVDFAFATSVFTHLRLPDVRHYLAEVRRSLKPAGRAMVTFFILDETNRRLVDEGKASLGFSTKLEDCYTVDGRTPERGIAYAEADLVQLVADARLSIRQPILWGSWSGRASMLDFQDVLILTRA